jgi:LPS-assembly protein
VETQFPVLNEGSRFNEIVTGLKFMPTPDFEFSLSNSNLHGHPYLLDSNQINLRAYWRCNEKWGLGVLQQWELDDSTLELEQYTAHRNYDNWVISAGVTHRNNRLGEEFGFLLNFTLKDFPSVTLPFSLETD